MNRRLRTCTAALAIILTSTFALGACSGDDDKGGGGSGSSAGVGEKASTEVTEANFAEVISEAQSKAGTSHMSMKIGAGGQTLDAEGDVSVSKDPAKTRMAMKMEVPGMGSMDMRLVDEVMYMNFGAMTESKFVKIPLDDPNNPIGAQYSQMAEQMDPSKQLELFEKSLKKFSKGDDTKKIDGVETTPYEIVIDSSKLPGMEEAAAGGVEIPKTLTYTMYLGPDNLPRRMVSDLMGASTTIDFSKWGEDVTIEAPTGSQLSDQSLDQLMGGQLGG